MTSGTGDRFAATADLLVVGAAAALSVPIVGLLAPGTTLRVVFGLALVLVLPGYAVVASLFPRAGQRLLLPDRVGGLERLVLSFAVSISLTPLSGMALAATRLGFRQRPLLALLAGTTLFATLLAGWRRARCPADERFALPLDRWRRGLRAHTVDAPPADAALTVATVGAVALLVGSLLATAPLSGALAAATGGEPTEPTFTEAFLLSPTDERPVADEYPTSLARNESARLIVGLENHEGVRVRYSVVVLAQRVEGGIVAEERSLEEFRVRLDPGQRWERGHTVTQPYRSGPVRLQYLIYRGQPPENPRVGNAYRDLHVRIDVDNS